MDFLGDNGVPELFFMVCREVCRGGMRGLTDGGLEERCWDWWEREGVGEGRRVEGGNGGLGRREALVCRSAGKRFPRTGRN